MAFMTEVEWTSTTDHVPRHENVHPICGDDENRPERVYRLPVNRRPVRSTWSRPGRTGEGCSTSLYVQRVKGNHPVGSV